MQFDSVPDLIAAMRLRAAEGGRFEQDDDPTDRTVGYRTVGERLSVSVTSLKKDRGIWPAGLADAMMANPVRRRSVAACVNHGHGFLQEDRAACRLCMVEEIMGS